MAVSPEQLLARARKQLLSADELDYREATKNAYYAAYHLLKPLESAINDPRKYSDGNHAQLIGVLANHSEMSVRAVAYMLRDCRHRRNEADYDIESQFLQETAKTQLRLIDKVFAKYQEIIDSGVIAVP